PPPPQPSPTLFPYTTLFRSIGRDDRIEVHARSGPAHEVAVVAFPVGEAVRGHVRGDGLRQVPLADVTAAIAGVAHDGSDGGDGRSEEHTSELQSLAYLVCRP